MSEEKKAAAESKPKNSGKALQIIFAVFNVVVICSGAYLVYASTLGWRPPVITEEHLKTENTLINKNQDAGPVIYTMEKFTVNLAGEPKKTIRLEVNLEMLGYEGFEEVMDPDNRARARDGIIRILGEKTYTELESLQGKLFLKNKIASEVNSLLDQGVVKDVYFTEFVVQ